ncbi:MAG TPA: ABC transporter substrate-binding protein [Candidatus Avacidaminococcus intestinavium]|uniref:ABC transporter substrate-binding protein n=1 Tax=Candidatus Avacidaminococcus intestinavium TaxID=2840684 RepID=A0A9D1SLA5_9FIRM|nr:ABC transporter substrate-binding protein [Candidatus Avacidaminococcus intestinavium]
MKVLAVAMVLIGTVVAGCGSTGGSDNKTVRLTDAGWDSMKFHNAVVSLIADKAYGIKSEVVTGSTPITHTALVRGDIDVNVETWTDNITSYADDIKSGAIIELGINFDDNKQGFYVPRYVIEGDPTRGILPVAPDLKTVSDLKRYSAVFPDEENPGKGRIYGAIPGWGIDEIMFKKFNYYGLNENFNYFRPGSDATLNASFITAYEKGLPIVGYMWEPTWVSGKLDLVLLGDEPYNEADYKEGKTEARSVPVTVSINKNYAEKAPEFVEFLKKYRTSSALTAEALAYIADTKASYDEAAIYFLQQHDDLLGSWLPKEKADSVRAAINK